MANPNPSFQSKRVKKRNQLGITSDRYEFLGLDQAEPDLGDPTVGVSSVGVNPFTVDLGDPYVLVSDGSGQGKRYWTQRANIIAGGVIQPGAISVYNNGDLAPGTTELSIFKLNFTGAGVTAIGVGSDRADVDITVTDVSLLTGQTGSIAYKDSNGLAQAADSFIFNPVNNNVGISSTQPTEKLDVDGNINVSGNVDVGSTITASNIKTTSFEANNFTISDNTIIFKVTADSVGIGTTLPISTLDVRGTANISGYATVGGLESETELISQTLGVSSIASVGSLSIGSTQVISSTRELQNITSLDEITTSTIETIIVNAPNTFTDLNVTGVSTLATLGVSGLTTTKDLDVSGVSTTLNLNVTESTEIKDLNVTGVSTLTTLKVTGLTTTKDLNVTGVSTLTTLKVTGLTTTKDLNVSGISTVNDVYINSEKTVSIASSVGIGTTIAKYDLDLNGDLNLTGFLNLNGDPGTDGKVLLSRGGANPPIWGDAAGVNVGSATSVTTIDKDGVDEIYNLAFVTKTLGSLNQSISLDSNNLYYNPLSNSLGIGTTELNFNLNVVGSTLLNGVNLLSGITTISGNSLDIDVIGLKYDSGNTRLGIGTTTPTANLNINGSTLLNGNNVLSGVTTVTDTLDINTTNVRYIPTTNRLGIGTTNPGSTLAVGGTITEEFAGRYWNVVTQADVGYGASQIPLNQYLGQLAFLDDYLPPQFRNTEVVTTSTSNVILDSLDGQFERSARYNIQITCTGQLIGSGISGSSKSVTNLESGKDYVSGSYTNIELTTLEGSGTDARANLTVTPEAILTLNAIQNGEFAFLEDVSALNVNKPVLFNQAIPPTAAENSRVTSIRSTNIGSGYTSYPSVSISSPTNNPAIPGVSGIGSTATAVVDTMSISNYVLTKPGIHTTIPIVTFNAPIGVGTTATGTVGFGISTATVINSGLNYSYIPIVSFPGNVVGGAASAIVSNTFLTTIRVSEIGYGYSGTSGANYPTIAVQPPTSGTSAIATVTTLGISSYFTINSPGIGYTRPPLLTVSSPGIGTTATIGNTLGVVTFTNISPGSGYTSSPILSLSPVVSNFSANVGMGVSGTEIQIFGGSGYESNPDITITPVGGIGTGAEAFAQINIGGQVESITITNTGFGYTVPPIISFSGGNPSVSAAATITNLILTNIDVNTIGFGVTLVPTVFLSPVGGLGNGASATPVMGIGTVSVLSYGSGYTSTPSIAVTSVDGIIGSGGSVTSLGLGVTNSNISIINPGIGYTFIPTITVSSPIGIGTSAIVTAGMGISEITVTDPGFGYSALFPQVSFSVPVEIDDPTGGGVSAAVSSIITTNVTITNVGAGYTQFDLAQSGIATFSPTGTEGIVGFGVSTFRVTNLGIGYTTAESAVITISNPNLGSGTTATATAGLGFPGVLPGPGYGVTTQIYYIASIPSSTTLKLSTKPGIGTLSQTDVANVGFSADNPKIFAGGNITNVSVVSPGSGYTSGSIVSVDNTFDTGNVGTGFSFITSPVDNFQVSDVMLLSSVGSANTSADFIEYSSLANNEILGSFSATMVSGTNPLFTANLVLTPTYRNNNIKISRNRFGV